MKIDWYREPSAIEKDPDFNQIPADELGTHLKDCLERYHAIWENYKKNSVMPSELDTGYLNIIVTHPNAKNIPVSPELSAKLKKFLEFFREQSTFFIINDIKTLVSLGESHSIAHLRSAQQ